MTYSIIAYDSTTGAVGAATATGSVAVGGFVLHVRFGAGAIATQGAFTNWLYGERGLDCLAADNGALSVRDRLLAEDEGADQRQFIVCDTAGLTAGHTGRANVPAKAHHCAKGLAVAGNMLANAGVLSAMQDGFQAAFGNPLHERLLAALQAGEDAGGDYRGNHSAAVKVFYWDRPPVDLRVDWADNRCTEALWQVYERTRSPAFQKFLAGVPTLAHPTKTGHVSDKGVQP